MTLKSRFQTFLVIVLTLLVVGCSGYERATTVNETGESDHTLIQLRDPLDEPEYYCVDVPGFGRSLDLEGTLTAHTCKPNADDELFMVNHPAPGQIYMPAYDRCMEASSAEANAALRLTPCSDSALQQISVIDDGTIQLQNSNSETLCLSVADEAGKPTGGPSHLARDLLLLPCSTVTTALSQWSLPGPSLP